MKKSMIGMTTGLVLMLSVANGGDGKKYGKELTVTQSTSIAKLLETPDKYEGKRVLISGTITDVCQSMGCWIKVRDDSGTESILFKVDDGVIEFPKEAKGKKVRAEGILSTKTLSTEELVKQAKHEAEEQGKTETFDPSTIKGPKTVVQINGEGAVIGE